MTRFSLAIHLFAIAGAIAYAIALTHLIQALNALNAAVLP